MNGRQAKKLLKSVSVVSPLHPGDTLVVRLRADDSEEAAESELRTAFPNVAIMFLRPGQSVSVIRRSS